MPHVQPRHPLSLARGRHILRYRPSQFPTLSAHAAGPPDVLLVFFSKTLYLCLPRGLPSFDRFTHLERHALAGP